MTLSYIFCISHTVVFVLTALCLHNYILSYTELVCGLCVCVCVWLVLHQEIRVELLLTLKLYSYSKGEIRMNPKFGESWNILFVQILIFWIFFLPLSKTDIVRKIICIQGLNTRVTYSLGSYIRTWKSFACHLPFTFSTKKMLIVYLMFFSTKILPENLDSVFSGLPENVYQNKHNVSFDYSLF